MTYNTITLISFICILMADVIIRINSFIGVSNGSTIAVAGLQFISAFGLLMLCHEFRFKNKIPNKGLLAFKLFMGWNIFSFIWGAYNAQNYWDWKTLLLNYSFSILIPLTIIVGIHYEVSLNTLRFILRKVFLFGFICIPLALATDYEMYARVVIGVSIFLLFMPYLNKKWWILLIIVAVTSISMDISYRSNTMRILFPVALLILYLYRQLISAKILNYFAVALLILPLLFLYLGVTSQFNVFQESIFNYQVYTGSETNARETNLDADTRTFLYKEVVHSMRKRNSSFLVGEGGGAAYETHFFAKSVVSTRGRYGCEVGFLDTLLYSGMVGVFFYALILFTAVYYAINRSNNYLCKMLGLFLAFHWVLFFIEDITKFDLNFFFIWLVVGLCMSNKFRELSDVEVKQFFGSLSNPVRSTAFNNFRARLVGRA